MPLTILHAACGAAIGAAFSAYEQYSGNGDFDTDEILSNAAAGAIAAALPDLLEPPTHRRHRSFFHSYATLTAAAAALAAVDNLDFLEDDIKPRARMLITAYMSHLALDSRTPMGLPVLFQLGLLKV